jgi:hypothetical protein
LLQVRLPPLISRNKQFNPLANRSPSFPFRSYWSADMTNLEFTLYFVLIFMGLMVMCVLGIVAITFGRGFRGKVSRAGVSF